MITPISWILLHEPQNDEADASLPIVTRTDDTYVTPTTKPVVNPPTSKVSTPPATTPTATPTPTPTPTDSATPTSTPSTADPTEAPTSKSTEDGPTPTTSSRPTPTPDRTTATRPTAPPTTNTPPPPPARDGGMNGDELQLFDLIDQARVANGCVPLEQDPGLTQGARSDAAGRSESASKLNASGSSMTAAGGDEWSPQRAYDQMMAQSRSTVLNCDLKTLAVGKGITSYCKVLLCLNGRRTDRVSWVADFT
ncbi:CAP domain-containing protein [Kribbella sp. CA-247076]|uniref:CAP domain-containing protein n=1 Tax=Kribbella sp. CA-247076 TaxID=3239941 RepID=UPI003D902F7A